MAVAVQPAKEVTTKKKPLTKQRRVVVTGMGVMSPVGHEPDIFYKNLLEGVSGITEIENFDCSHFPTVILINLCLLLPLAWSRFNKYCLYTVENCGRDQVLLHRWLGCSKTFQKDGQVHAILAHCGQESPGRWWNFRRCNG